MTRPLPVLAALLLLAACGTETSGPAADDPTPSSSPDDADPTATPTSSSSSDGDLFTAATVLEGGGHGPQLCLGGVMESYPPQCGGPDLAGWDWDVVGSFERAGGTTWGDYVVIGTYDRDADSFTLTEPAVPVEQYDGPQPRVGEEEPAGTPCDEPDGGWQVRDPALTTQESLAEVQRVASRLPGFAGLWWDQSINPAYGSDDPEVMETEMNDPEQLVVNVSVTGDVADAEAALREVWGGSLCVSQAQHTEAELRRIQRELTGLDGALGVGTGRDRVELSVVHDDGTLQAQLDEEYGDGVVVVTSALQPYPG